MSATKAAQQLLQAQHIAIAELSPDVVNLASRIVKAVVTIKWPYSSINGSVVLNLAEPSFRLRHKNGQVRARFFGSSARALEKVGSGDTLTLSLIGAEVVVGDAAQTSGRSIPYELKFGERLILEVRDDETQQTSLIDIDHPPMPEPIDTHLVQLPPSEPILSPANNDASFVRPSNGEYSSPAFLKRARESYGSFAELNNLLEDDNAIISNGRKKQRFSFGRSWRYESRTPSPEPESAVIEDKPSMTDEASQTIDSVDFRASRASFRDSATETMPDFDQSQAFSSSFFDSPRASRTFDAAVQFDSPQPPTRASFLSRYQSQTYQSTTTSESDTSARASQLPGVLTPGPYADGSAEMSDEARLVPSQSTMLAPVSSESATGFAYIGDQLGDERINQQSSMNDRPHQDFDEEDIYGASPLVRPRHSHDDTLPSGLSLMAEAAQQSRSYLTASATDQESAYAQQELHDFNYPEIPQEYRGDGLEPDSHIAMDAYDLGQPSYPYPTTTPARDSNLPYYENSASSATRPEDDSVPQHQSIRYESSNIDHGSSNFSIEESSQMEDSRPVSAGKAESSLTSFLPSGWDQDPRFNKSFKQMYPNAKSSDITAATDAKLTSSAPISLPQNPNLEEAEGACGSDSAAILASTQSTFRAVNDSRNYPAAHRSMESSPVDLISDDDESGEDEVYDESDEEQYEEDGGREGQKEDEEYAEEDDELGDGTDEDENLKSSLNPNNTKAIDHSAKSVSDEGDDGRPGLRRVLGEKTVPGSRTNERHTLEYHESVYKHEMKNGVSQDHDVSQDVDDRLYTIDNDENVDALPPRRILGSKVLTETDGHVEYSTHERDNPQNDNSGMEIDQADSVGDDGYGHEYSSSLDRIDDAEQPSEEYDLLNDPEGDEDDQYGYAEEDEVEDPQARLAAWDAGSQGGVADAEDDDTEDDASDYEGDDDHQAELPHEANNMRPQGLPEVIDLLSDSDDDEPAGQSVPFQDTRMSRPKSPSLHPAEDESDIDDATDVEEEPFSSQHSLQSETRVGDAEQAVRSSDLFDDENSVESDGSAETDVESEENHEKDIGIDPQIVDHEDYQYLTTALKEAPMEQPHLEHEHSTEQNRYTDVEHNEDAILHTDALPEDHLSTRRHSSTASDVPEHETQSGNADYPIDHAEEATDILMGNTAAEAAFSLSPYELINAPASDTENETAANAAGLAQDALPYTTAVPTPLKAKDVPLPAHLDQYMDSVNVIKDDQTLELQNAEGLPNAGQPPSSSVNAETLMHPEEKIATRDYSNDYSNQVPLVDLQSAESSTNLVMDKVTDGTDPVNEDLFDISMNVPPTGHNSMSNVEHGIELTEDGPNRYAAIIDEKSATVGAVDGMREKLYIDPDHDIFDNSEESPELLLEHHESDINPETSFGHNKLEETEHAQELILEGFRPHSEIVEEVDGDHDVGDGDENDSGASDAEASRSSTDEDMADDTSHVLETSIEQSEVDVLARPFGSQDDSDMPQIYESVTQAPHLDPRSRSRSQSHGFDGTSQSVLSSDEEDHTIDATLAQFETTHRNAILQDILKRSFASAMKTPTTDKDHSEPGPEDADMLDNTDMAEAAVDTIDTTVGEIKSSIEPAPLMEPQRAILMPDQEGGSQLADLAIDKDDEESDEDDDVVHSQLFAEMAFGLMRSDTRDHPTPSINIALPNPQPSSPSLASVSLDTNTPAASVAEVAGIPEQATLSTPSVMRRSSRIASSASATSASKNENPPIQHNDLRDQVSAVAKDVSQVNEPLGEAAAETLSTADAIDRVTNIARTAAMAPRITRSAALAPVLQQPFLFDVSTPDAPRVAKPYADAESQTAQAVDTVRIADRVLIPGNDDYDASAALAVAPNTTPLRSTRATSRRSARSASVVADQPEDNEEHITTQLDVFPKRPYTPSKANTLVDRSASLVPDTPQPVRGNDASADLTSPSKLTKTPIRAQHTDRAHRLLKDLRLKLPGFLTLKSLKLQRDAKPDIIAVVTIPSKPAEQSKKGPKDFSTLFSITDNTTAPISVTTVQIFRPYKAALPIVDHGDVILLRRMRISHSGALSLNSGNDSSWVVFKEHGIEEQRGPPVEFGDEEREHAAGLKAWWAELEEGELKRLGSCTKHTRSAR